MKIGILREERIPIDNRVPLTPNQCQQLIEEYPSISLFVQSSNIRCFQDSDYEDVGIKIVDDISGCDLLLGIKEVPITSLITDKTYLFFSHTIKKQDYNRELLRAMLDKRIRMVDYEVIKDKHGKRLLGFGRYAGIIGAYNGLLAYGKKTGRYKLRPAHLCKDREEIELELKHLRLFNEKIILTGNGRVGKGVLDILNKASIKQVSKTDFINDTFNEAVFVQLNIEDYNKRIDGTIFNKLEFYNQPQLYSSSFMRYAKHADIFIAGHYYGTGSPFLLTREDVKSSDFKIKVVADISCDINGSIACSIRSSEINSPIYGYNPITQQEDDFREEGVIAVMAVGNLPSALPKDASRDFGESLLDKIFCLLINQDRDNIIKNATICQDGSLTPNFEFLRSYLNGF